MAGDLWGEYPEAALQTHYAEQMEEIEWVSRLYPEAKDYLDSLTQKIIDLVGQSLDGLEPASLSYCRARCGFAMNRRRTAPAISPWRRFR